MGDNLIASSVLPQLKKQGYMVEVMATPPSHVVFEHNPYVDKLTVLKGEHLPNNNADWQQYFVKRSYEYDKFFHLSHSIESHVAFRPDSTWFWWPASYRRKLADKSYLELTHDICEVPHDYAPDFFPTEEEIETATKTKIKVAPLGEKIIGWVVAGSRIDKLYPYSTMAVARLLKETGARVIMFSGLNEREWTSAKAIMENVALQNSTTRGLHYAMGPEGWPWSPDGKKIDPDRKPEEWPLRRSLTMLRQCDLVISPDTGLAWSVAVQPMPKIVLLGHASVKNITHGWVNTVTLHADETRVKCWPCHLLHSDTSTCVVNAEGNGSACISDISVETIVKTAKELLECPT